MKRTRPDGRKLVSLLLLICISLQCFSQDTAVHRIRKGIDIPLTAIGILGTIGGVYLRQNKDHSDSITIVNLDPGKLSRLDQRFITQNDFASGKVSDVLLASGFVVPWFLAFDKQVRSELGMYTLLYLETMGLAGMEYYGTAGSIDKYRPYVYNPDVPMWRRVSKQSKNSFFAGHVTVTGAGTFFAAQVFNDLHPDSPWRFAGYGIAAAATATCGYLRYRGGFHFFSDILIGTAAGTATGILVPVLHRRKKKSDKLSVMPFSGDVSGLVLRYKIE